MAGIYISWPFCAQKCTYCNFASGVQPRGLENDYLTALLAEIDAPPVADTLYIGGGTPSAIDPPIIEKVLAAMPHDWREATIEAAPGTLTPERIRAWRRYGVNRISLGVQSFIHAELARTGRKHDAVTVENDVTLLRNEGIENITLDLIAGLPGQTPASWQSSLDALIALDVPHASVYMLEIDDDSRLGSEIILGGKRYGACDVPNDDRIADFYETAVDQLARSGLARYEISNFARPGAESLHNLKYWHLDPYFGFGSDAHSFDGTTRWQNVETAAEYVERSKAGESVRAASTRPDPIEEKFFVGLRLAEGVQPDASDWQRYGPAFERHLSTGMMESPMAASASPTGASWSPTKSLRNLSPHDHQPTIDLRSDTVTKPTLAMRQAMFDAEVGDDVYGEDPTVNRLEARAAEIAGKEAALFIPTGTMGNTIGIKLLTEHGQEVISDSRAHLVDWELSMTPWFSGCQVRTVDTPDGILTWDRIRRPDQAGDVQRRAHRRHRS